MPLHHARRSRRLSRKSPVEVADYDWSHQLLHNGSDVEIAPFAARLPPPSPSGCTTTSSESPPPIATHLPFTPGSSHTRNRKEGHIPRPPNAFMVFRSWLWNKDNLKSIERDNRNVSRIAGRYWNELSEAERAPFRSMAEQAKARHAQLYPEYRYSPGSQKKPKVSQRRPKRSTEVENEKCNKVVNLLMGGLAGRDLAKHLNDAHKTVQPDQGPQSRSLDVEGTPSESSNAAPLNNLKRSATPHESPLLQPESKKPKTHLSPPLISTSLDSLSDTAAIDEWFGLVQSAGPLARTPELVYPTDYMEEFVATADIPYLSLDGCSDLTFNKNDDNLSISLPSHLSPGAHSVFSGVKPEAASFAHSCMLSAYTANAPVPVSHTDYDIGSYSPLDSGLVPLGSPVFSNPFEPSTSAAEHAALLGTLDQLFGQPVSPHTRIFPTENW